MGHLEEEVTLDTPAMSDSLLLSPKWEGGAGCPEKTGAGSLDPLASVRSPAASHAPRKSQP